MKATTPKLRKWLIWWWGVLTEDSYMPWVCSDAITALWHAGKAKHIWLEFSTTRLPNSRKVFFVRKHGDPDYVHYSVLDTDDLGSFRILLPALSEFLYERFPALLKAGEVVPLYVRLWYEE